MNDYFKNIFSGAGTIINIFPSNDYNDFINPRGSTEDAFSHNWERVGQHLNFAIQKGINESGFQNLTKKTIY